MNMEFNQHQDGQKEALKAALTIHPLNLSRLYFFGGKYEFME